MQLRLTLLTLAGGFCTLGQPPTAYTQPFVEIQKVKAHDAAAHDMFGDRVAIDGNFAIVSAIGDDDRGNFSGSVYVFERNQNGRWQQVQKLHGSETNSMAMFGQDVAISGERAIIGAPDNLAEHGAAYIFERKHDGTWVEAEILSPGENTPPGQFGFSVSLSGNRALVGSQLDNGGGNDAGAAYLFERDDQNRWNRIQKLTASDAAAEDLFGWSVCLSGDHLAVGAAENDARGKDSGAVYLFERNGDGHWAERQKLTAGDGAAKDEFGYCVSLDGDHLLVGARGDDKPGEYAGAAYVFERDSSGKWTEMQKLKASDPGEDEVFGHSVSVSGDFVSAGARGDEEKGYLAGAVHVFERDDRGRWNEIQKLTASDAKEFGNFGGAVSLSAGRLVIGAMSDDNGNVINTGAAYFFEFSKSDEGETR